MDRDVLATIAANLESQFEDNKGKNFKDTIPLSFETVDADGNAVSHAYELKILDMMEFENDYGEVVKAIAFQDENGNIYVHYNGTGEGNWRYNDVAFGGGPSKVQEESLAFFDRVMVQYCVDKEHGNVYVSGHSQGGNNAEYVTLASEHSEYIDTCMALDAPGFSKDNIDRLRYIYGETEFGNRCQKIYAYNGDCDYVSALGQVFVIPPDHYTWIKNHVKDGENAFMYYHFIDGMMDDGHNLEPKATEKTPFRLFVEALVAEVNKLPPEDQKRAAELVMKLMDQTSEEQAPEITLSEIAELIGLLSPAAAKAVDKNPELAKKALEQFGIPADAICDVVELTVMICYPALYKGFKLVEFAEGLAQRILGTDESIVTVALAFIKETVNRVKELTRSIMPGEQYVARNPYFRADPQRMRDYAERLDGVNRRITQLDRNMNSLYTQVRLVDLGKILTANLLATYSLRLNQSAGYLRDAAQTLENADSRALACLGG